MVDNERHSIQIMEGIYWKQSAEMLASMIHLMRGTPYIYQGEELGMTNPHYHDIRQYRDVESLNYYKILLERGKSGQEALAILSARSRDNGRSPMQWSCGEHAGFTTGRPWIETAENYQTVNAEAQISDPDSIWSFYKKLIALRKSRDAVSKGSIEFLEKENPDIFIYKRVYGDEEIVSLNNLTPKETEISSDPAWADYKKILGNYDTGSVSGSMMLKPFETIILEK